MNPELLLSHFVIILKICMILCLNTKKVPAHSKLQSTCQYRDFLYTYFYCDNYGKQFKTNTTAAQLRKCIPFRGATETSPALFVLYDVNPVEGFNLRRDVYIRMAVFLKSLAQRKSYENSYLVLPPFYQLYHWNLVATARSNDEVMFWNHFFDLNSMRRYANVIDLWEYFEIQRDCFGMKAKALINHVFKLRHFESMFQSGKFEEKFEVQENCGRDSMRSRGQVISLYSNFTLAQVHCVEFQGAAGLLFHLLEKFPKRSSQKTFSVAIMNAETVLHDYWGGAEYWMARRSMRFNSFLANVANAFRSDVLNSTDESDATVRPKDWRHEKEHREAKGGNYLCAHLRRADFLHGREETTPSLRSAATQILQKLKELQLKTVFVSSDCTGQEYRSFKSFLSRYRVTKFTPSTSVERERLKPGGIAIVDQIICSHARFFIGTYESTFTYRIYEEREIIGFPTETTFNTFCKLPQETEKCSRNSVWPIVFERPSFN